MLLNIVQCPRSPTPQGIVWPTLSILAMLTNLIKFSCKLVIWLCQASRKVGNCSLYSERLSAYLNIRDSITRKGRVDMIEGNYSSAPYCPIISTSNQRDLRAEVCYLIRVPSRSHDANSYPALTGQFLKQNQPFA